MFSRILAVHNHNEWIQTRKATLIGGELCKTIGYAFGTHIRQFRLVRQPEPSYIVVIGDFRNWSWKNVKILVSMILVYIFAIMWLSCCKTYETRIVDWQARINQPGFTWTKVTGGMLSYQWF